ncbi:MAG: hypothetical protein VR65_01680 [Desulfobulbaceae bacterium BRH_c16a]|nr:MAG: hypothetical protein VR65_01680 [Desulfobulbaceae bacterium BRH_c16a]
MTLPSDFLSSLTCPHTKEILEDMQREDRPNGGKILTLRNEIAPSDLFCYFAARFGRPNGIQNLLRTDDSDNLIHWEWVLRSKDGMLSFLGMNFRTEVWVLGSTACDGDFLQELVKQIKADFSNHGKLMSEIRKSLEDWIEFVNPYQRLRAAIERLRTELDALQLRPEDEAVPDLTSSDQIPDDRWGDIFAKYTKGLGLCFGIRSMLPVMAEAYVNLLLFVLMRPELKADERLRENTIRQPIDIRVKTLHMTCVGFEKPVDYAHDACKAYHSLVNERNDLLHGNVVLEKLKFNEVFFNGRVPVFKEYRSLWERSIGVDIRTVGLHRLANELNVVDNFIDYLRSRLSESLRAQFERISIMRDLGLNKKNGRIGILFPGHLVDMFAVQKQAGEGEA